MLYSLQPMISLQLAKYTGRSSSYRDIYSHIYTRTIITSLILAQPPQLYKSNLMRKASIVIAAMGWYH
uniref:Uncharacterized protein n=1 Tax=Arundo donax TaxID=35708 RepID=A0A0A9DQB5_ARUDO